MNWIQENHLAIGVLLVRLFLGFLFFFQGYDAVFVVRIRNVAQAFESQFTQKGIPSFLILFGAGFTSLAELIGGSMLLLGIGNYPAMLLLGINMVFAGIGFGLVQPMWDLRHVFPRMALLVFLFMIPPSWDQFSLDALITHFN